MRAKEEQRWGGGFRGVSLFLLTILVHQPKREWKTVYYLIIPSPHAISYNMYRSCICKT